MITPPPSSKDNAKTAWARIKRNLGILLGERAIFAVVNLLSAGLATRVAGLEAIGAIGLLLAYARLIADVVKFNSWQALLTFGTPLKESAAMPDLRRLTGLTLWVDICAVILSLTLAVMGARVFGEALGWTEDMIRYAPWFCIMVAFFTHMTPTGILRLYDRVPLIAAQHATNATVRMIGVLAIWYWGGGVFELALVWTISAVAGGVVIYIAAWIVAARNAALPRMAAALREGAEGFSGFWRFIVATNFISTLDKVVFYAATLIVGAVLGPLEAGLFHIVRQITEAMVRPGDMLGPLFFPEIALLEAKNDRRAMRRLVKRAMIYSGAIMVVVVGVLIVGGELLLTLLFGPEAGAAYDILILAGISSAILVWGFTLEPTLLSLGQAGRTLYGDLLALFVFAGLTAWFIQDYGLVGMGIALIGHRVVQMTIRAALVARLLSKSRI